MLKIGSANNTIVDIIAAELTRLCHQFELQTPCNPMTLKPQSVARFAAAITASTSVLISVSHEYVD